MIVRPWASTTTARPSSISAVVSSGIFVSNAVSRAVAAVRLVEHCRNVVAMEKGVGEYCRSGEGAGVELMGLQSFRAVTFRVGGCVERNQQ